MGYLFAAVVAVALLETLALAVWVPLYFRLGLPVYRREIAYGREPRFELLEPLLEKELKATLGPSIVFQAFSPDELAFRERLLELRLLSYTPLMHGLVRLDAERRVLSVSGYLNWYIIAFCAMWYALPLGGPPGATIWDEFLRYGAPPIIMALIYLLQCIVYGRVVRRLREHCGGT